MGPQGRPQGGPAGNGGVWGQVPAQCCVVALSPWIGRMEVPASACLCPPWPGTACLCRWPAFACCFTCRRLLCRALPSSPSRRRCPHLPTRPLTNPPPTPAALGSPISGEGSRRRDFGRAHVPGGWVGGGPGVEFACVRGGRGEDGLLRPSLCACVCACAHARARARWHVCGACNNVRVHGRKWDGPSTVIWLYVLYVRRRLAAMCHMSRRAWALTPGALPHL